MWRFRHPARVTETTQLLLLTAAGIASIIILIAWLRINAFLSLMMAALLVGIGSGMTPAKAIAAFGDGIGATMASTLGVLALGTMLGGLLAASGGAEVLGQSLVRLMGPQRVHWALMILALAVGFTTWFAVGLVMLMPILLTLAKETKVPFLKLALPMLAVLSIMHGTVPPHPGPLVAIDALHANLGMVIVWALVAAIPMAALSGPLFARWAVANVDVKTPEAAPVDPAVAGRQKPTLARTVAALTLPIVLILSQTVTELVTAKPHAPAPATATATAPAVAGQPPAAVTPAAVPAASSGLKIHDITAILGHPMVALGIAVLFAGWAFGFTRMEALKIGEKSLGPIAMTLMLVAAGGGFNRVLRECGAAGAIGDMASAAHMPPMLFGWVCAALIRVATGSATVAITAACGMVAPLALATPGLNLELMVVCIGCGSLFLSHLNDAGFWIVKELLGMTVSQTLRTWTVVETLIGVSGLFVAWGLDTVF